MEESPSPFEKTNTAPEPQKIDLEEGADSEPQEQVEPEVPETANPKATKKDEEENKIKEMVQKPTQTRIQKSKIKTTHIKEMMGSLTKSYQAAKPNATVELSKSPKVAI